MNKRLNLRIFASKTERDFEQFVVANAASLNLTLKEMRDLRWRIESLEGKANLRK